MAFMVREFSQPYFKASQPSTFNLPLSFATYTGRLALSLWPKFQTELQSDRSRGGQYV